MKLVYFNGVVKEGVSEERAFGALEEHLGSINREQFLDTIGTLTASTQKGEFEKLFGVELAYDQDRGYYRPSRQIEVPSKLAGVFVAIDINRTDVASE